MIRLVGVILLALTGYGTGVSFAMRKADQSRTICNFARLLEYMARSIAYRASAGDILLENASAYPEYASFCKNGCRYLDELEIPGESPSALASEIRMVLNESGILPRDELCRTLELLAAQCRTVAEETGKAAQKMNVLYPRLGGCLGAMVGILFL